MVEPPCLWDVVVVLAHNIGMEVLSFYGVCVMVPKKLQEHADDTTTNALKRLFVDLTKGDV
jgi:hypothetical protein